MTAQIGDSFTYKKDDYTIVAKSKSLDVHPSDFGIYPQPATTACWRGYWCAYDITDTGIYLRDLYVNSSDDNYPDINGVSVLRHEETGALVSYMGHRAYKGLDLKIPYTGKILVGKRFMRKYYIHMGFQRPWAYKVLKELVFENGTLTQTNDQSKIAATLRKQLDEKRTPEDILLGCIPRSVEDGVSLDYDVKAWWLEE